MSHIKIYVSGGVVHDVDGLPDGWTYEVVDADILETATENWLEQNDMPQ